MRSVRSFLLILAVPLVLAGSPTGAQAPGMKAPGAGAAEAAVRAYVRAWSAGDLPAMYRLWDARSRRMVTLPQLQAAFTRHPAVTGWRTGAPATLVVGRPDALVGVRARAETEGHATVDCVARFTFKSLCGYPFSAVLPGLLQYAAKKHDGIAVLFIALAGDSPDAPKLVDTAKGGAKAPASGQGASDTLPPPSVAAAQGDRPPFITLYFHRYALTREGGGWRIANAVAVRDHL